MEIVSISFFKVFGMLKVDVNCGKLHCSYHIFDGFGIPCRHTICYLIMHCVRVLLKYLTKDRWKAIQPKRPLVRCLVGNADKYLGQLCSMCNKLFSLTIGRKME